MTTYEEEMLSSLKQVIASGVPLKNYISKPEMIQIVKKYKKIQMKPARTFAVEELNFLGAYNRAVEASQ